VILIVAKERSGRPSVARTSTLQSPTSSSPRTKSSSAHNSVNSFAGETLPQDLWSESWSHHLVSETSLEENHHPAVGQNSIERQNLDCAPPDAMTSSLSWRVLASEFPSPRDIDTPPPQQQELHGEVDDTSVDDTSVDMNELSGLDSSIYQFQVRFATVSLTPGLCDDMTAFTRTLLDILGRTVDGSRRNRFRDHQDPSLLYSPAYPSPSETFPSYPTKGQDALFRRQNIHSSIYPDEDYAVGCGVTDTSTIFLILACYQRLSGLFKQVCISIHMQLEDNAELQSSTAQFVMTTELISHLLGRLDRGLQQLFPTGPPSPPLSRYPSFPHESMLTPPSMFNVATNASSVWSLTKNRSAVTCEDPFSNGASSDAYSIMVAEMGNDVSHYSWSQGVSFIMRRMVQRQKSLKSHLSILKHLVQESNKF
jgi:hypothetical protein